MGPDSRYLRALQKFTRPGHCVAAASVAEAFPAADKHTSGRGKNEPSFLSLSVVCQAGLLHFGAKISDLHAICCILELKSLICLWLLDFAFGFWLWLFAFGSCFWLFAFGWVLVLKFAYDISYNTCI